MTILEAIETVIEKLGNIYVPVAQDYISGQIREAIHDLAEIHKAISKMNEQEEKPKEEPEEAERA